jgi:hypothetical protein
MEFSNEQAQGILNKLHAAGIHSAILAGGCVRDALFGKPIKDIDIFVSEEDADSMKLSKALSRSVQKLNCTSYAEIPDVSSVFDVEVSAGEIPVQIVSMKNGMSPVERISTFDFGFCQVGYNGKEVIATEHFKSDFSNKTISLVYCEDQKEYGRSMARYERLKTKYPEFNLISKPLNSYPSYIGS